MFLLCITWTRTCLYVYIPIWFLKESPISVCSIFFLIPIHGGFYNLLSAFKMYFPFNNLFCVLCKNPEYDTDYAYLQFYFNHENGLLLTCIPSCLRGRISLRDSERVEGFSLLISRIQKHSPEWCLDTSVWPISWRMRMCIVKPTYSEQNLTPFPFRRMPRISKWTYVMNFSFFKLKTR